MGRLEFIKNNVGWIYACASIVGVACLIPMWLYLHQGYELTTIQDINIYNEAAVHGVDIALRKKAFYIPIFACLAITLLLVSLLYKYRATPTIERRHLQISPYWYGVLFVGMAFIHLGTDASYYYDMFEMGNAANTVQRVKDGEWPFIDYLSSHLISEQLLPILYQYWGNTLLGWTAYDVLIPAINAVIAALIMVRIMGIQYYFIPFILMYPFIWWLFPKDFVWALIPLLLLYNDQGLHRKSMILAMIGATLLLFWKLDVGLGAFVATAVMGLYLIWQSQLRKWSSWVISIIMPVMLCILAFILLQLINGKMWNSLQQAIHYFGADQAHGRTVLTYWEKDYKYYFHYFLFPAIGVILPGWAFLRGTSPQKMGVIVFLTIFYIINFQRGLVRHSFTSGTDVYTSSYFYLLVVMYVLSIIDHKRLWAKPFHKALLVLAVSSCTIFAFKPHIKYKPTPIDILKNKFTERGFSLHHPQYQAQLNDTYTRDIGPLKAYLDTVLLPNQSFIDMSNRPVLYYMTERSVPSYFNQFMQNTITDKQQKLTIEKWGNMDLPIVIYRHRPVEWLDKTDGIPNSMRYHLLHRYIADHYRPIGLIADNELWLKNGLEKSGFEKNLAPITSITDSIYLGKIPTLINEKIAVVAQNKIVNDTLVYPSKNNFEEWYFLIINHETPLKGENCITFMHTNYTYKLCYEMIDRQAHLPLEWMAPLPLQMVSDVPISSQIITSDF